MLTVDYDRLGLEPGDLLLDIGAGFGRHAFEAFRRGATPVACDLGVRRVAELQQHVRGHGRGGRVTPRRDRRVGPGLGVAPAFRRRRVRPGDRLGGTRTHCRRPRRDGRVLPGPPPGRDDRRDRSRRGCPRRCAGGSTRATTGPRPRAAMCASIPRRCSKPASTRPGSTWPAATTRTGCTPRTGGSSVRWGWSATTIPWSAPTTSFWCGTSPNGRWPPGWRRRALNPVIGKSLVVYARKPVAVAAPVRDKEPADVVA